MENFVLTSSVDYGTSLEVIQFEDDLDIRIEILSQDDCNYIYLTRKEIDLLTKYLQNLIVD